MRTVRVRFANGAPEPLERLDLHEGQEVVLSADGGPPMDRAGRGMRAVVDAWKGIRDPEKLKLVIYAAQHCSRAGFGGLESASTA